MSRIEYQAVANNNLASDVIALRITEEETAKKDKETRYLTERESECLKWVIHGKTSDEIAIILSISRRTVEMHLNRMKEKFNCHKLTQLVYLVVKEGLL